MRSFLKLFCAQLIATCKQQPAQLSATYKWHNPNNFHLKKLREIHFQKQVAFLSFAQKSRA
jgi:hypothetical protein